MKNILIRQATEAYSYIEVTFEQEAFNAIEIAEIKTQLMKEAELSAEEAKETKKEEEKKVYLEGECGICKKKTVIKNEEKKSDKSPDLRCDCGAVAWINGEEITWRPKKS